MMMGFWLIVLLIMVGAVAYPFGYWSQHNHTWPAQTSQPPLEILKSRYARGEITREEYEQLRRDLDS